MADRTGVLFVCLGNICRSPLAHALFVQKLSERGLLDTFEVDSAGTAAYHAGEPPDPRTVEVLRKHGVRALGTARQVVAADFDRFDHILAMDQSNLRALQDLAPKGAAARVHRMLEPTRGGDVPDPYYGGDQGFEHVYTLIDGALEEWLARWTP
ncbi:MAG: low molecular weight protein-tyrosine-phosphatase [Myxococcota bacterium]